MTGFNFLDLPQYINSAVLGGNSLWVAQMGIDVTIIFMVMVTLLVLKATIMQVFLVEFMIAGILTGLGWLPIPVFVGLIMILAIGFAAKTAPVWTGGGKGAE